MREYYPGALETFDDLAERDALAILGRAPTPVQATPSSVPQPIADAPRVMWALDFQCDATMEGNAIKIASMLDEHTRVSILHRVDRYITDTRLVAELATVFAVAVIRPPKFAAATRAVTSDPSWAPHFPNKDPM